MEIYRYITSAEQERIQKNRALFSRDGDSQGWVYAKGLNKKPIYGLPDNPLVWGLENSRNLLDWIFSVSGLEVTLLIKFNIDTTDTSTPIYTQDQSVNRTEQERTRKHVSQYRRGDYVLPEVLVGIPIPSDQITVIEFPKELIKT